MYCTPIVLNTPKTLVRKGDVEFSQHPPMNVHRHVNLEIAKQRVGDFRIKSGDAIWKSRVSCVDRHVSFPDLKNTKPPSRAYYKLVEILRTCAIDPSGKTLHLCDAPGGFTQAVLDTCPDVTQVFVTSIRQDGAPLFTKSLFDNSRVEQLHLPHSSNLLHAAVREQIQKEVSGCSLITADGAVDNERQPELSEAVSAHLMWCEIATALATQAEGGTFVLKIFSATLDITRECIAALSWCYSSVSVVKPFTSRVTNDERYIVCQGFCAAKASLFTAVKLADTPSMRPFLTSLGLEIDSSWLTELDGVVHALNQQQMRAIDTALALKDTLQDAASERYRLGRAGSQTQGRSKGRGRGNGGRGRGRKFVNPECP